MYKDLNSITQDVLDIPAVNNSIKNIITTRRGSVPGNPKFGCDIHTLLFSQLDTLTEALAKSMITTSLQEFEDRINLEDIEIKSVPEYNRLVINIVYQYKDSLGQSQTEKVAVSINY